MPPKHHDSDEVLSDDADVYSAARSGSSRRIAGGGRSTTTRRTSENGQDGATKRAADIAAKAKKTSGNAKDKGYAWEATYKRSWDAVREDAGGSLAGAVRGLLEASKRRRTLHDSAPVQRGIIRHLVLILDLSESMLEKDLRPSRFLLTLQYAREFVSEYFDQNPIGQMSILATREGVAERVTSMSGNTAEHIESLQSRKLTPKGEPSLQNALEMARSNLAHLPSANSREVLVIFGSLTTCDPGNIHDTVSTLAKDNVHVSMVCLAAEVKVCKEICKRTHGKYGVSIDEGHYRDLLFDHINPPEVEANDRRRTTNQDEDDEYDEGVDLMQMGFPARLPTNNAPTLCACHNRLKSGGYVCPRCLVKLCDVPTDCPVCGLTVVMSTHLARSYHHLFPVPNYIAIGWKQLQGAKQSACFGCAASFEPLPDTYALNSNGESNANATTNGDSTEQPANVASSGRYECPKCRHHFCLECDAFIHESLHQCPGCQ
ncbi:TFIIH basal transcription factor complex, subunit SSL1 [Meira miltonrushii]|uniref:General transcription and DNA repair factor IIH n=1 Tax=Meira miltonrushii TaxID=1280837 RepID=A0A316V8Y0_9BASI|nr:TFIIH basal transcription factor complex, subunit SSL1 [Meira miltonrushii]PWN31925.1 TFIIH basal transcription factor complex, subunit SSL1 [Meira miltonrushii]